MKRCCPLISSKPPKPTTSDFSLRKCDQESLTSGILSFLWVLGLLREGDDEREVVGQRERKMAVGVPHKQSFYFLWVLGASKGGR